MESRKAASEEVRLTDVTCGGRPFQIRAAATGKARKAVIKRVRGEDPVPYFLATVLYMKA